MTGLPLQVDQAGKRSEDLMKLHKDGKAPGEEPAPSDNQDHQPEGELQKQLKDLQTKYDVLSGKYKKEIENADLKDLQRLQNENTLLKREITQVKDAMRANEDLVKEVRAELEKGKPPVAEAPTDVNAILSEEERKHLEAEDLGGKTLEIFLKLARVAGGSNLADQIKKVSSQVEDVSKRIENTEKAQHQTTIDSAIPDFAEINNSPEFHQWLDQRVSEFSQRTNRLELQESLNAGDIQSVRNGIDAFKTSTGWKGTPPRSKETPPKKDPKLEQLEPDESFSGDGEIAKPKKEYKLSEVKKFYEDQTKGKWKGREKEAAAIDKDIILAQQEGRIKQ